jgi:succinate dehydrogenase / fumarate reductase, iron-sulfur subunit
MAEFTLPKNSKIGKGKHFPATATAKNIRSFKIYRWNPDDGANPRRYGYLWPDGIGCIDQNQK